MKLDAQNKDYMKQFENSQLQLDTQKKMNSTFSKTIKSLEIGIKEAYELVKQF